MAKEYDLDLLNDCYIKKEDMKSWKKVIGNVHAYFLGSNQLCNTSDVTGVTCFAAYTDTIL